MAPIYGPVSSDENGIPRGRASGRVFEVAGSLGSRLSAPASSVRGCDEWRQAPIGTKRVAISSLWPWCLGHPRASGASIGEGQHSAAATQQQALRLNTPHRTRQIWAAAFVYGVAYPTLIRRSPPIAS